MIEMYLTDLINISTYPVDEWGVVGAPVVQTNVKARIEDVNELVKDKDGKEVMANTKLFVDVEALIIYESKINLIEKNGIAYPIATKDMVIKKMIKAGGFKPSHWEVWL